VVLIQCHDNMNGIFPHPAQKQSARIRNILRVVFYALAGTEDLANGVLGYSMLRQPLEHMFPPLESACVERADETFP
jgi:hypothetical protein